MFTCFIRFIKAVNTVTGTNPKDTVASLVYAVDKTMIKRGVRRQYGNALQFVPVLCIDDEACLASEPEALLAVLEYGGDSRTFKRSAVLFGSNGSERLQRGIKTYHPSQCSYPIFTVTDGYDGIDAFCSNARRIRDGKGFDAAGVAV